MNKKNKTGLKMVLTVWLTLLFMDIEAQIPKEYQNKDRYSDSIALDYLRNAYPGRHIGYSAITLNNETKNVRNYNSYVAFELPIQVNDITIDTIRVVNFGVTSEHDPCFMLVLHYTNKAVKHFVLGKAALNNDVKKLQRFLKSLKGRVKENHLIEIWDLFVKCKQGIIFTPLYIHELT